MSTWSVDPAGVQSVLNVVCQRAGALATASDSMFGNVERAASSSGSQIVAQALSDFLTARAPELANAAKTIDAAVSGAAKATRAYEAGDQQMAVNARSLSLSETHG
ncbi:hypothetical protein SAMN05444157_0985 [Frankineae bacterium MT45]|nr:hypothetical protein SAMN05444157_0985 [Frankineae bacterium MT45]